MSFEFATFFRTTLPLDLSQLEWKDSGRYHSIMLPDHMVSFWPDSIWTPEFTDLATVSHSPHRYVDGLGVAAAAAVLTTRTPLCMCVVDTVRRHPSLLAQTALTISHLSKGRFILGLGSGEKENILPYGFDFNRPVSRFEEALRIIKLLWSTDGPVNFEGQFYTLHNARLDTELYDRKAPPIWMGANGPRMLDILGKYADGWLPAGVMEPEEISTKLAVIRKSAERAGRDPLAITAAFLLPCLVGTDDELEEMFEAPLVKSFLLQISADYLKNYGYSHPMGDQWSGFHDIEPDKLTRDRILEYLDAVDGNALRKVLPHGTPKLLAEVIKSYADAGVRVVTLLDYGGMAGLKFAANSQDKVRATEDEALRLINGPA